jgi:hypothetical protein
MVDAPIIEYLSIKNLQGSQGQGPNKIEPKIGQGINHGLNWRNQEADFLPTLIPYLGSRFGTSMPDI